MRKAEFSRHIQYFWWCYLLVFLASVVLWTSVYGILEKPDANEKLTISYFASDYNGEALENEIRHSLSSITEQEIKELSFDYVRETSEEIFGSMLQTRLFSSDIMIFAEGRLTEDFIQASFYPLSAELKAEFEGINCELYTIGGTAYGILLNPEGETNNFSNHYSGEQRLIALFAPYCENLGGAYGLGNVEDSAAVDIIKYFLEDKDG